MNNSKYSLPIVIVGMLVFTVICNSKVEVPSEFLIGFLVLLHVGMIWLVITILKDSKPPVRDFDRTDVRNLNDSLRTE